MVVSKRRTVFFDLGGTLIRVRSSVGEVYADVAARHGFVLSAPDVEANFRSAWDRSVARSRDRGHTCSDEILRAEWFRIVQESLGDSVPAVALNGIFEELFSYFASGDAWTLAPGALESFDYLRARGIRLGVLSNWDSRFRVTLRELELESAFDFLIVSHAIGYEKPHEKIFRAALRMAAVTPAEAIHIGDSLEADIMPARRIGLSTIWVASEAVRSRSTGVGDGVDSVSDIAWDVILG